MGYDFQKIKQLVDSSGMSRKEFFAQIGMSEKTLSSWINGTSIPKETSVCKIATRLGVSLADLRTSRDADAVPTDTFPSVVYEASKSSSSNPVNLSSTASQQKVFVEFCEAEINVLRQYTALVIFDTCSIMNFPDLLNSVRDSEMVVIPKDVNNELERNKTAHYDKERAIKAQKAITAIFNFKKKHPVVYSDAWIELVPEAYRADDGERESNDNKILSVAIRYKRYTDIHVIFITDDRSLSNKASGEYIEVWTAEDFITSAKPRPVVPTASDYTSKLKKAEQESAYNKIVIYSIILRTLSNVKKNIGYPLDESVKALGELYITLRTKKQILKSDCASFAGMKNALPDRLNDDEALDLSMAFNAAYRDALSSLGGSIKQIAGDLE